MSDDNDPDDVRPDDASVDIDEDRSQATTDPSIQDVRSDSRHPRLARSASVIVMALAGLMMTTAAINSRGHDLRPERDTDMATLVRSQASHNAALQKEAAGLRAQVEDLSKANQTPGVTSSVISSASALAPSVGKLSVVKPCASRSTTRPSARIRTGSTPTCWSSTSRTSRWLSTPCGLGEQRP